MFKASLCCEEKVLKATFISKFLSGRLVFWRKAQFSGKAPRVLDELRTIGVCVLLYRGRDLCCLANVLGRKLGQVFRRWGCIRAKDDQARGGDRSQARRK